MGESVHEVDRLVHAGLRPADVEVEVGVHPHGIETIVLLLDIGMIVGILLRVATPLDAGLLRMIAKGEGEGVFGECVFPQETISFSCLLAMSVRFVRVWGVIVAAFLSFYLGLWAGTPSSCTRHILRSDWDAEANERFVQWLRENGAPDQTTNITQFSMQRGLRAVVNVTKDVPFSSIPLHMILTEDVAFQSDIGFVFSKMQDARWPWFLPIAAYIVYEKHQHDSFWAPYLDVLPRSARNVVNFPMEEMVTGLRGTTVLQTLRSYRNNTLDAIKRFHTRLLSSFPLLFQRHRHTLNEFVWASVVVLSRSFALRHSDEGTGEERVVKMLPPHADMINHAAGGPFRIILSSDNVVHFYTNQGPFQPGDEVTASYGTSKANWELLRDYGVVVDDFHDDHLPIDLEVPSGIHLYSEKQILARLQGLLNAHLWRWKIESRLIAFFRLCVAQSYEELDRALETMQGMARVSVEHEARALDLFAQSLVETLQNHPTTLEEDEESLTHCLTPIQRLFLRYRVSEKTILHQTLTMVRDRRQHLDRWVWRGFH